MKLSPPLTISAILIAALGVMAAKREMRAAETRGIMKTIADAAIDGSKPYWLCEDGTLRELADPCPKVERKLRTIITHMPLKGANDGLLLGLNMDAPR